MKTGRNTYIFYDGLVDMVNRWGPIAHEAITEIDALIDPLARVTDVTIPHSLNKPLPLLHGVEAENLTDPHTGMSAFSSRALSINLVNYILENEEGIDVNGRDCFVYLSPCPIYSGEGDDNNFLFVYEMNENPRLTLIDKDTKKKRDVNFNSIILSSLSNRGLNKPLPGLGIEESENEIFKTLVMHEYLHAHGIPGERIANAAEGHCTNAGCTMNQGDISRGWDKTKARLGRGYPVCDDCRKQIEKLVTARREDTLRIAGQRDR